MKKHYYNLIIGNLTILFAVSCASVNVDDAEQSDTSEVDSGPIDEDTGDDTDTEKQLDTDTDTRGDTESDDTESDSLSCGDDNPSACGGVDCIDCTVTDKPLCAQGSCVECLTLDHCGPDQGCSESNECIDPCAEPTVCPVPEPRCEDGNLVTSSLENCDPSTGTAVCKYKETTQTCELGCVGTQCNTCSFDEDGDEINDVVEQPSSSPTLCWRRCALPTKWDGTKCQGSVGFYNWSDAQTACEGLGYRVPQAAEYTGPSIAAGILNNCVVSGPDSRDWDCDSCAASPDCSPLFGNDQGTYWTSTSTTYYLQTNYYKANLADGTLNFVNGGHTNGARCVKNK